jgi:hypothetical protein
VKSFLFLFIVGKPLLNTNYLCVKRVTKKFAILIQRYKIYIVMEKHRLVEGVCLHDKIRYSRLWPHC